MQLEPLQALRQGLRKLIDDVTEKLAQVSQCFINQPSFAMAQVAALCGGAATAYSARQEYLVRLLRSATENIPAGGEDKAYAELRSYVLADIAARSRRDTLEAVTVRTAASLETAVDAMMLFAAIDRQAAA